MSSKKAPLLKPMALLGLAALLAGCTTLTQDLPASSESVLHPVEPEISSDPTASSFIDSTTGEPVLEPETDEEIVLRLMGPGDITGGIGADGGDALVEAETYVYWTCRGTGPISIMIDNGPGYEADCKDMAPDLISRNSYRSEASSELKIVVEADPAANWEVLLTQATG